MRYLQRRDSEAKGVIDDIVHQGNALTTQEEVFFHAYEQSLEETIVAPLLMAYPVAASPIFHLYSAKEHDQWWLSAFLTRDNAWFFTQELIVNYAQQTIHRGSHYLHESIRGNGYGKRLLQLSAQLAKTYYADFFLSIDIENYLLYKALKKQEEILKEQWFEGRPFKEGIFLYDNQQNVWYRKKDFLLARKQEGHFLKSYVHIISKPKPQENTAAYCSGISSTLHSQQIAQEEKKKSKKICAYASFS